VGKICKDQVSLLALNRARASHTCTRGVCCRVRLDIFHGGTIHWYSVHWLYRCCVTSTGARGYRSSVGRDMGIDRLLAVLAAINRDNRGKVSVHRGLRCLVRLDIFTTLSLLCDLS
jgi:hypothetical protein